ncbi:CLUMA_CG013726, isoform A [Clunio marinus]|uniref:CLUMA_CG013726, isoform A n=1 Tax=Clunio marinus TaxID=568069 RepID=A0A1J1IJN9_9DIPT|nr:CLUMA_CG013726, isoform A [Clunio marinus]
MVFRFLIFIVLAVTVHAVFLSDEETTNGNGRIMGGTAQTFTAMASIRVFALQGDFHVCGGFIVSPQFVVTAAQCTHQRVASLLRVRVGSNSINPPRLHQIRCIRYFNDSAGSFNPTTKENDIALLRMETNIVLDATTSAIGMAMPNSFNDPPVDVHIFGWGATTAGGALQTTLRRGIFRVASLANCRLNFPAVVRSSILDSHMCTSWAGRATCAGDIGGPIVHQNQVVGIVSWVDPCTGGQVNVNTRMSVFSTWINTAIFVTQECPTCMKVITIKQINTIVLPLIYLYTFCTGRATCAVTAHAVLLSDEETTNRNGRIMGGTAQTFTAMASIRVFALQGDFHVCGGFIVSPLFVVTAAQCTHQRNPSQLRVRVGGNTINPPRLHQIRCIRYANDSAGSFNPTTKENDIALLRMETNITFDATTSAIAMAFPNTFNDPPVEVNIFGWGASTTGGNLQNTLLRGIFRVTSLANCRLSFPPVMRGLILNSHMCTAWAGRATCTGDVGGPIVHQNQVVGIVSWVDPCTGGQVNVNTRMSDFSFWITTLMLTNPECPNI